MSHLTEIVVEGQPVPTLADILPTRGTLRVLFVGKAPSPGGVASGHYFEGRTGRGLWKRLNDTGLMPLTPGEHADDHLLAAGFGVTDLSKVPRATRDELTQREYCEGWSRVGDIVATLRPRILVFVYRGSLDKVLRYSFGWDHRSVYGFNDDLMRTFGRRVFVLPMPGTACTAREIQRHMADLAGALEVV